MKETLPEGYRPSDDEPFMNTSMQAYFRHKLLAWRSEILKESNDTIHHLQETSSHEPDLADRASLETDRSLELRTRDRERKLLRKIGLVSDVSNAEIRQMLVRGMREFQRAVYVTEELERAGQPDARDAVGS